MLKSSIIYLLIRTLPESIILMLSGYMLLGIEVKSNLISILKKGIILGIFIYFVRALPINFGIHTILSMIIQGMMLYVVSNKSKNIVKIMVTTCQVWLSLILSEAIYVTIAVKILNLNINKLIEHESFISAITTLPSLIVLILIVFLFRYFNKNTILKG